MDLKNETDESRPQKMLRQQPLNKNFGG